MDPGRDLALRLLGEGFLSEEDLLRAPPLEGVAPPAAGDRFEILEELGRGGSARVFRARDRVLGTEVALKRVALEGPGVERELRALRDLCHERIPRIHDVVPTAEGFDLVLDLVRGETLEARVHDPSLSREARVRIVADVARVVHFAHEHGYVHRDLKPANVLLDREGHAHVLDFGIAKAAGSRATLTGALLGTPHYMSPEQARGNARGVDRRSDVYSLGAILHELLAGSTPFDGRSVVEVLDAVVRGGAPSLRSLDPTVPEELAAIVARALAKDPDDRFRTARELAFALESWERAPRRRPLATWAVILASGTSVGIAVGAAFVPPAPPPRPAASPEPGPSPTARSPDPLETPGPSSPTPPAPPRPSPPLRSPASPRPGPATFLPSPPPSPPPAAPPDAPPGPEATVPAGASRALAALAARLLDSGTARPDAVRGAAEAFLEKLLVSGVDSPLATLPASRLETTLVGAAVHEGALRHALVVAESVEADSLDGCFVVAREVASASRITGSVVVSLGHVVAGQASESLVLASAGAKLASFQRSLVVGGSWVQGFATDSFAAAPELGTTGQGATRLVHVDRASRVAPAPDLALEPWVPENPLAAAGLLVDSTVGSGSGAALFVKPAGTGDAGVRLVRPGQRLDALFPGTTLDDRSLLSVHALGAAALVVLGQGPRHRASSFLTPLPGQPRPVPTHSRLLTPRRLGRTGVRPTPTPSFSARGLLAWGQNALEVPNPTAVPDAIASQLAGLEAALGRGSFPHPTLPTFGFMSQATALKLARLPSLAGQVALADVAGVGSIQRSVVVARAASSENVENSVVLVVGTAPAWLASVRDSVVVARGSLVLGTVERSIVVAGGTVEGTSCEGSFVSSAGSRFATTAPSSKVYAPASRPDWLELPAAEEDRRLERLVRVLEIVGDASSSAVVLRVEASGAEIVARPGHDLGRASEPPVAGLEGWSYTGIATRSPGIALALFQKGETVVALREPAAGGR